MRFDIEDILIFGMGYIEEIKDEKVRTKKDLKDALGISRSTLDRTLLILRESGFIEKSSSKNGIIGHDLKERGRTKYYLMKNEILNFYLTPEKHFALSVTLFPPLVRYISDPMNVLKIVSHTHLEKRLNVLKIFQMETVLREDLRYMSSIDEVLSIEDDGIASNPENLMKDLTNLGLKPGEVSTRINDPNRYKSALATAEFRFRSGKLEEAISIYSGILNSITGLPPNIWIIAYTRFLKCIMGKGDHETVLMITENIDFQIDNPVHKAMILQIKADALSFMERYWEAEKLYKYCMGVYYKKDLPILLTTVLNNIGVMYFRMEKFDIAESQWKKARKAAKDKDIPWMRAIIDMNLGDHYSFNLGQIRRGKDRIRKAKKIMEGLNDLEGVADAHFNYSLVCIEEGKVDLALTHFKTSMEFPFHDNIKKNERIKVFDERVNIYNKRSKG